MNAGFQAGETAALIEQREVDPSSRARARSALKSPARR